MSHKKIRQSIIETCLEMNRSGLNQGTSGNLSHRVDGGMLITPTSLPYDRMKPEDIVEISPEVRARALRCIDNMFKYAEKVKD